MSETVVAPDDNDELDPDWQNMLDDDTESGTLATEAAPAPVAAATPEPIVSDEPAPDGAVDRGDGRDAKGRFIAKAKEGDELDAAVTEAVTPKIATPPVAVAPVAPVVPAATPWSLRVSGREIPIPGATYEKGKGLSFADETVPAVQKTLLNGLYYEKNWKDIETKAAQKGYDRAMKIRSEKDAQAEFTLAEIQDIVSSEDKLFAFAQDLAVQGPLLLERARARSLEEKLAALTTASAPTADEAAQTRQVEIATIMDDELGKMLSRADLAPLFADAGERQALEERLWDLYPAFVDPVRGFNVGKFEKHVAHEASLVARTRQGVDETKRLTAAATEAAKFNAGNTPRPAVPTKPVRNSATRPNASAPNAPKDEYRDWKRDFQRGNPFEDE